MKILAAVVTYNRMQLLERCVDALRAQIRPADGILVINNSSPDGTVAMLEGKAVDYVTQPNSGSAGGWKRAIAEALERGYDAVWLMDDDGYPAPDALGRLEEQLAPGISCVSSVVLCQDDPDRLVFPSPILNRHGLPVLIARKRKIHRLGELKAVAKDGVYPFAHLFNGALIPTEIIRRIGNVESDYFLMGDEVDYFMRMRAEGAVLSILAAHHLHPDVSSRPLDEAKFYYFIKNSIILNRRYFDRPMLRNLLTVAVALARAARRNSIADALSYVAGRRAPVLWKAVARGLKGKIGKDLHA
jgi:rhamnopyranosyl-N-acetylglucosaminyl-diphospho-decaprenol beta-1,3/1,4-galactofuranosyltransferase